MTNVDFAKVYKYKLSHSNELGMDAHVVDEVISSINEGGGVKLSPFVIKRELNPDVWVGGRINSRVRLRLLDIADDFIDTLSTDWVKAEDILLLGSMANYNWSKYSDFDVHVVMDFSKVDSRTDFVKDYFNSKKAEWNSKHEGLSIYGHPVEMYVQDVNEGCESSGVYSLEKDKWLQEPERDNLKSVRMDRRKIISKSEDLMRKIEGLEECAYGTDDDVRMREISSAVKKLWDKIKGIRREDLKRNGEMSVGNIIYKVLRRAGYLDRLMTLKTVTYDKIMSLD